jgi:hypothetical protein
LYIVEKSAPKESSRMKVMKFIYGDLTPAKVSDLKQACKQEVEYFSINCLLFIAMGAFAAFLFLARLRK